MCHRRQIMRLEVAACFQEQRVRGDAEKMSSGEGNSKPGAKLLLHFRLIFDMDRMIRTTGGA